jgi:hypothetical protein
LSDDWRVLALAPATSRRERACRAARRRALTSLRRARVAAVFRPCVSLFCDLGGGPFGRPVFPWRIDSGIPARRPDGPVAGAVERFAEGRRTQARPRRRRVPARVPPSAARCSGLGPPPRSVRLTPPSGRRKPATPASAHLSRRWPKGAVAARCGAAAGNVGPPPKAGFRAHLSGRAAREPSGSLEPWRERRIDVQPPSWKSFG